MILYFDTETTGLKPGHVIQLAYILDYGDQTVCKNFYFYTDYIEPSAVFIHGITIEKLEILSKGLKFDDYIDEIEDDFSRADLVVAHNFNFDFGFMSQEFKNNLRTFRYKESLDTMKYFTPVMKLPRPNGKGVKYPKLEEFCVFADVYPFEVNKFVKENFSMDDKKSHDAAYDTAAMFLAVQNSREKLPDFNDFILKYLNRI